MLNSNTQLPGFITFVGAIHDQRNFPPGQGPVPGAVAGLTTNVRSRAELARDLQEILRIKKNPWAVPLMTPHGFVFLTVRAVASRGIKRTRGREHTFRH